MAMSRQFRLWHWTSSALCLIGVLFFAVTGITLNHAADIPATPLTRTWTGTLPLAEAEGLRAASTAQSRTLPAPVADWLREHTGLGFGTRLVEWSEREAYVALPRPGGDAWVALGLEDGEVTFEHVSRGPIAFLNDLHKGRDTGPVWSWFLDLFAAACVVFSLTGLGLLWTAAAGRPSTWPLVGAGAVLPGMIVLFFLH